jgi:hypothetical protein
MAWRFFRSLRVLPGVRVNFSKMGLSVTLGNRGATLNIGRTGVSTAVGLPGSGISFREKIFKWRRKG